MNIYKPNSQNTGSAITLQIGYDKKTGISLYLNGIKQYSWDTKKRTGSFSKSRDDPSKNFSLKFNEFEAGAIIRVLQKGGEWSSFHGFDNNKTSIGINLSKTKESEKSPSRNFFSLHITRNSTDKFSIPIEINESIVIIEYLKFYLRESFYYKMQKDQEKWNRYKGTEKNSSDKNDRENYLDDFANSLNNDSEESFDNPGF
jgi:hypothetical protein